MCFLDEETRMTLASSQEYYDHIATLRRAIKFKPNTRTKTFPWPGASNIVVPLIRIAGDAVKARIVNTLLTPQPFWICNAPSPGSNFEPFAKPWQNFLNWGAKNDMDIESYVEMIADQVTYMGKCPVKVYWNHDVKKIKGYNQRTGKIQDRIKTFADGPIIEPIVLENFIEPWGICDTIKKPWLTQRTFARIDDLRTWKAQRQIYPSFTDDDFKSMISTVMPEDIEKAADLRRFQWLGVQIATLYETDVYFDIDQDNFAEHLTVLWSPLVPSKPLSVRYNIFWHGKRPIYVFWYLRDSDDRSSGDGIAQLLYPIQDALSTFINQRTDNITIANTMLWLGKKNVVKATQKIWPGMVLPVPDPTSDLKPLELGQVSPNSFQHESILRDYAERLSGISDPQLGREMDNPRVAATTTLSMIQEGNKRFDMIIRLMRVGFAEIGVMVSQLYQQFKPRLDPTEILSVEDAAYVDAVLAARPEDVEANFVLSVNASSVAENKEADRQAITQLYAAIDEFYKNVMAVAQQIVANPQIPGPVKDIAIGIVETSYNSMRELVISYNVADPDTMIFNPVPLLEEVKETGNAEPVQSQLDQLMAGISGNGGMGAGAGGIPPEVAAAMGAVGQSERGIAPIPGAEPGGAGAPVA